MKNYPLAFQAGVRITLWFAGALLISSAAARDVTRAVVLEAIHQIENPTDRTRPGPYGELGAYQFRSMTWRMHTHEPFVRALDRDRSDAIAEKHYEWLRVGLENAGRPATPYMIGLAWNGGLEAAIRGTSPRAARDYAQRVANLAAFIERDAAPIAPVVEERPAVRRPVFEFKFAATAAPEVRLVLPLAD